MLFFHIHFDIFPESSILDNQKAGVIGKTLLLGQVQASLTTHYLGKRLVK